MKLQTHFLAPGDLCDSITETEEFKTFLVDKGPDQKVCCPHMNGNTFYSGIRAGVKMMDMCQNLSLDITGCAADILDVYLCPELNLYGYLLTCKEPS